METDFLMSCVQMLHCINSKALYIFTSSEDAPAEKQASGFKCETGFNSDPPDQPQSSVIISPKSSSGFRGVNLDGLLIGSPIYTLITLHRM
jgi:hypothetical protein